MTTSNIAGFEQKSRHIDIQIRLKRLNKTQRQLARLFHRGESQVSQALRGVHPTLLNKIIKYLDYLEGQNETNS